MRACCGLRFEADAALFDAGEGGDLLVPGGSGVDAQLVRSAVVDCIGGWHAARPGHRLISVCSGAPLLAAAGVLSGLGATTHRSRAASARERFPRVLWQPVRLCVERERVMASAGVTAGIDLAPAIVRRDRGPSAALAVGRELVVQMRRSGGQAQSSAALTAQHALEFTLGRLAQATLANPGHARTLDEMARGAAIGPRTLSRHLVRATGLPPAKFVERMRIDRAGAPPRAVASRFGLGDPQRMRRAFVRRVGSTAAGYRAAFGTGAPGVPVGPRGAPSRGR